MPSRGGNRTPVAEWLQLLCRTLLLRMRPARRRMPPRLGARSRSLQSPLAIGIAAECEGCFRLNRFPQRPASSVAAHTRGGRSQIAARTLLRIRRTATLSAVLARPPGYPDASLFCSEKAHSRRLQRGPVRRRRHRVDRGPALGRGPARLRRGLSVASQRPADSHLRRGGRRAGDYLGRVCGPALAKHYHLPVGRCRRGPRSGASVRVADAGVDDHWSGIPDGWMILSGYRPAHAAACGARNRSDGPGSWCRIGDTVFGRPAYPLRVVCGGRSAENRDRAVPSGGDRYDRWTSGRAGRGWRLDRRWVGEARRSSYRCSARTLGGLPDHRGPLDEGRLGGLGRASGALRRFGACALGRRPGLRRRACRALAENMSWRPMRCCPLSALGFGAAPSRSADGQMRQSRWVCSESPSIPHLCIGAAAEAGPYCMAQSTTGCVRHARDRSAMGRRGAKRLREKASARWWRCAG